MFLASRVSLPNRFVFEPSSSGVNLLGSLIFSILSGISPHCINFRLKFIEKKQEEYLLLEMLFQSTQLWITLFEWYRQYTVCFCELFRASLGLLPSISKLLRCQKKLTHSESLKAHRSDSYYAGLHVLALLSWLSWEKNC